MHYVSRGQGKPLLFLHGFPSSGSSGAASSRTWARTMPSTRRTCAATTSPASRRIPRPTGCATCSRDVVGLVEELDLAPLTLVGHDWGGIVSWAFALKYPEMLERLVIIDAPPPFTWNRDLRESPKQRDAVNYMVELSKPSPEPEEMLAANDFSLMDNIMRRIGGRGAELSDCRPRHLPRGLVAARALRGGLNYYRAARMGDQVAAGGVPEEYASKITSQTVEVPTLVIWGENDAALLPTLTRGLSEWVPHLRVEIVPGAGHWVPYERPEVVNSLIREFVDR